MTVDVPLKNRQLHDQPAYLPVSGQIEVLYELRVRPLALTVFRQNQSREISLSTNQSLGTQIVLLEARLRHYLPYMPHRQILK